MRHWYLFVLAAGLFASQVYAQDPQTSEMCVLIDQPTAGSLHKSDYALDVSLYPGGGALADMQVGLFDRFMLGVSYGGRNVIGRGKVEWNKLPGVLIKYRLFEESLFPALSLGFDSQGYGLWSDSLDRYEIKAKGLFAVASKNFTLGWFGSIGFHGGVNYNSFETTDQRSVNGFLGVDKSINGQISLIGEYNLGLDDNNLKALGKNRGYLNAGIRWVFARQLSLAINFKDILQNRKDISSIAREARISYVESF
jgi:hypothetical protein